MDHEKRLSSSLEELEYSDSPIGENDYSFQAYENSGDTFAPDSVSNLSLLQFEGLSVVTSKDSVPLNMEPPPPEVILSLIHI